jgi:hypothetical protein
MRILVLLLLSGVPLWLLVFVITLLIVAVQP